MPRRQKITRRQLLPDARYGSELVARFTNKVMERGKKGLAERIVYDRTAPSTAMRRMVRALQSGGVVSITAGAWEGNDLVDAPLLGGTLSLAVGAPRLALLTGAALLPVFSVRNAEQRLTTVIEAPIGLSRDSMPADACGDAAAEYLERHEPWIRQFPEQWRGWKEWRNAVRLGHP